MTLRTISRKYLGWCHGIKAAADFEQKNVQTKLEIFPVVAFSTLAIIAYLLLSKARARA